MPVRTRLLRLLFPGLAGFAVALIGAGVAVAVSPQAAPETDAQTLRVGDRDRTFIVRTPPNSPPSKRLPAVIVLHGGGGNARSAEQMSQMTPFARQHGFVVVYPNGTGRQPDRLLTWNAGNCCGYAQRTQVDDVAFLRSLIQHLIAKERVDPRRVYITGMSNGGMMAHRVAMELGDLVAAVAPVAGAMNSPTQDGPPVGILMIHGADDQNVRVEGGAPIVGIAKNRVDRSMDDAVKFWVQRNGLTRVEPVTRQLGPATITTYPGTPGVETVVIAGVGHAWPGGRRGSIRGDTPGSQVQANVLMWEFFQRHQSPANASTGRDVEEDEHRGSGATDARR